MKRPAGFDPVQYRILSYLISDAQRKLKEKRRLLRHVASHTALYFADFLHEEFETLSSSSGGAVEDWYALYVRCRELYGMLGGALIADHWQSPGFDGSVISQVGDEARLIVANVNDYKRDQHPVGVRWERAYVREYLVGRSILSPVIAHATVSGMAALTAACLVIRQRLPKDGVVALGEHSYFENKELISMMLGGYRIVSFDETDPEALTGIMPDAVFFDVLANDPAQTVADVSGICAAAGSLKKHVDIAADTTCIPTVRIRIPKLARTVSFVGYESLNKYHQFGLDRVTGGIVWAYRIPADMMYKARDHAGVVLPEASAATLPIPDRSVSTAYSKRLEENAQVLAQELERVQTRGIRVQYAGLPSHPGHAAARRIGYSGSCVAVELPGKDWKSYTRVMRMIVRIAKKKRVPLIAGTSFGLPVSRVYTWTPRSPYERVFLRIAAGLESSADMRKVTDIVASVLSGE